MVARIVDPIFFFVLSRFRGCVPFTSRLLVAWLAALAIAAIDAEPQRAGGAEAATARRFAAIRQQPLPLVAFLRAMPKGGDLHNHLSGAVYAESLLRWAAEDNLCLATATMTIVSGTCDADRPPVTAVLQNATLYNGAIDAISMRHWDPAQNGHDHFFASFGKFSAVSSRTGDMLAEVTARAAAEHVSYLELMVSLTDAAESRFARQIGWTPDLAQLRERLLAAGFREAVAAEGRQRLDTAEARRNAVLRCGDRGADAGCLVTVRYVAIVLRAASPEMVFSQLLAGFELAALDPRVVSVNLVQPEDDPSAIANFVQQMNMLDFLHGLYPRVPITLHAGELTEGLVAPEALRFHIRQSIERGHALRIGHGVSVIHEDDPFGLLRAMAARKVLVEIALTSNDVILGVKGNRHPLNLYLRYGVPVALVTDDAGVSRSTHTQEFVRAVEEHGVDYRTLKRMARNSLEYAFADARTKARLKSELETAFTAFERRQPRQPS
jgi:adenosine deaminase